jgi:hypothetical protein
MNGDELVEKIREFNNDIVIILSTGFAKDKPPIKALQSMKIQRILF